MEIEKKKYLEIINDWIQKNESLSIDSSVFGFGKVEEIKYVEYDEDFWVKSSIFKGHTGNRLKLSSKNKSIKCIELIEKKIIQITFTNKAWIKIICN